MTNSVCNSGQDSTRPPGPATDRYGDAHTSRFVRPLAGRSTLISIDEFVLVAQNVRAGAAAASVVGFRRWPRRTAGRGLGSLSRFGDGVDQSVVAALFANGSGVRGRPNAIASPGSLQRQPPAGTGMNPRTEAATETFRARARPPVDAVLEGLPEPGKVTRASVLSRKYASQYAPPCRESTARWRPTRTAWQRYCSCR